ncbi:MULTISPECIES: protein kinase [unclassified Amycolatopsis]|uniref:protein kinase domain-containing protein n=1 Tax=unclassified Amycolatopsis TaxID=2618356 RepID=UPI00106E0A99|nr:MULTISPECIES: protein kinase [unclassified Amycolatopsis]
MPGNPEVVAGRFTLLSPLGRGNMGEVYLAEDLRAESSEDRQVAIKLILRSRSGQAIDSATVDKATERFAREVRIMRRLDHSNLPRLIDGGVDAAGLPYLAMELLHGRTLRDLISEHPQLPPAWVAALGAQIADGLAAAHGEHVIHRDLKPSNVMVVDGGTVKVLDFGMSLVLDEADNSRITSTGVTVGTARYMAPEQFKDSTVGPAADLYALGCVLYELLTGVPPFSSTSGHELGQKHLDEQAPSVALLRQDVPGELARLIEKLLSKDPVDRPVDAATVRDDLLPLATATVAVPGWDAFDPVQGLARVRIAKPAIGAAPAAAAAASDGMDVFSMHEKLIKDYREFTGGGTLIRDQRISEYVERDLDAKSQWPDPWLSLNPFFASGGTLLELTREDGLLHPECARIFQAGKTENSAVCDGRPLTLHRHQREAIEVAQSGASYVLTTGTGSGKSLSYLVPIVDRVLKDREREGATPRKRVRAIIVYPMNALANSQLKEMDKFLFDGYGAGREPVTYARYTGQENEERRKEIRDNPPDILLTNYVMLELMLTRPDDRRSLIRMANGLDFLVFDELHTYRGRQGADVALLIRRVREACQAENVQCIGTSATMSSEDTFEDRKTVVAKVATTLFGVEVAPDHVIGETLVRATDEPPAVVPADRLQAAHAPRAYADLVRDPLARWIETRFGLTSDETGRLVRSRPAKIEDAARELAARSRVDQQVCAHAVRETLKAGSEARHPTTERPLFAFRLHQFLSKGDTVYVTLEDPSTRHRTRDYQRVQPGSGGKILLPLAFCRECGQEYLTVWRTEARGGGFRYEPRRDTAGTGGRAGDGYLYVNPARPWPGTAREAVSDRRVPDSWLVEEHGEDVVKDSYRERLPVTITVDEFGNEGAGDLTAAFIPAPFRFCLQCNVSYEQVRGKDFAKLATLDQEGRSSATSLVSASILRSLKEVPAAALDKKARKLLTFVDNRQDASLQAGHFNDFVQVTQLRAALYRAVAEAGEEGVRHEELAARVAAALNLEPADYAQGENLTPSMQRNAAKTLQDVIAFRLYTDLQRGWRVTMPNLEQTGLLQIQYEDLDWLSKESVRWQAVHPDLRDADPALRREIMEALLDHLRRGLAIDVQFFRDDFDNLQRASEERLVDPWVLAAANDRPEVGTAFPQSSRPGMGRAALFVSGRTKYGKYLRRLPYFKDLSIDDTQKVIEDLLTVLKDGGQVAEVEVPTPYARRGRGSAREMLTGYRVRSVALVWKAGTGEVGAHDPLARTYATGEGPRVNPFFRELYRDAAGALGGLVAKEHTAQVPPGVREERENDFRKGNLKLLYCSPTMELGVDIAELNAVMMRNVPPTAANYAQRSGRAGRSGQPALVTTYCATGNSHDQYYFRRSERMVSGVITRPRLDLTNEDLVRSHVQAIWLAEAGLKLGNTIPQVLDVSYDKEARTPAPDLDLLDDIDQKRRDAGAQERTAAAARAVFGSLLADFAEMPWWDDLWLDKVSRGAGEEFNRAFNRWRNLFTAALRDQAEQNRRVLDHTLTKRDQDIAVARRREAETQLRLLKNENVDHNSVLSDFNPYRYLASEGFLPGYSFPRLPLAAYIPSSGRRFSDGDYVQRPRFLAIREFGPGALVYHEGARYQVTRIQLPPDSSGDVVTTTAQRCTTCGYHHDELANAAKCEMCGERLPAATSGLLQLHTVYTRKRERISSDEEERRRAGFRLVTSYRFHDHGERPGRRDALVGDGHGDLATVIYGDSATVRITNVGRLRAKEGEPDGFWLDPADGRWMNEQDAADAAGDSSELPVVDSKGNESRRKKRVIPYVEDRRNVLVFKLAEPVDRAVAVSLMYALERGIEAEFELEDSELTSELLPPDEGPRDRMLFTEAAEGGAGVLKLMQSEPDALARAAATALDICHFDLDGTDRGGPHEDRPCARGCYECLLTYGNQSDHGEIDRHSVRDLLVRLAGARSVPTGAGEGRSEQLARLSEQAESSLEVRFVEWLKHHGLRLPDETQKFVPDALARPDYVYRLPGAPVAVFIDGPVHDDSEIAQRDADAAERLYDKGWDVVRFRYDDDWTAVVEQHRSVFGSAVGL